MRMIFCGCATNACSVDCASIAAGGQITEPCKPQTVTRRIERFFQQSDIVAF